MRLLADQNIPRGTVESLREEGHDVTWVQTAQPGADDDVLLDMAANEKRVVITFDIVVHTLQVRDDWAGHFSVIEDARIRMRPLPKTGSGR